MDPDAKKEIEKVETLLHDIRDNTFVPWWRTILNGFLYGAGVVIGTILAIAALGWLLSIFGILPGFSEISSRLQDIMNHKY